MIVALVAADWASKVWITNRLALGETIALIDGWLYFVHRRNNGVAFGLFADLPPQWGVPLISALSLVGVILFARILGKTPDPATKVASALMLGGAFGNIGDRVWTGQVTDFVFLAIFPYVFNLADAAITLGGAVLALRMAAAGEQAATG